MTSALWVAMAAAVLVVVTGAVGRGEAQRVDVHWHCGLHLHSAIGPASPEWIADRLADVNRIYSRVGIEFTVDAADESAPTGDQVRNDHDMAQLWLAATGTLIDVFVLRAIVLGHPRLGFAMPPNDAFHAFVALTDHDGGHVFAHELGHVFGLQHSDDPANLMWPTGTASSEALTEVQAFQVVAGARVVSGCEFR